MRILAIAAILAVAAAPAAFGQDGAVLLGPLYPEDWEYERLATDLAVSDFNKHMEGTGWHMDVVVDSDPDRVQDARLVVGDVATAALLEYAEAKDIVLLGCCPGPAETTAAGDKLFGLAPSALS